MFDINIFHQFPKPSFVYCTSGAAHRNKNWCGFSAYVKLLKFIWNRRRDWISFQKEKIVSVEQKKSTHTRKTFFFQYSSCGYELWLCMGYMRTSLRVILNRRELCRKKYGIDVGNGYVDRAKLRKTKYRIFQRYLHFSASTNECNAKRNVNQLAVFLWLK